MRGLLLLPLVMMAGCQDKNAAQVSKCVQGGQVSRATCECIVNLTPADRQKSKVTHTDESSVMIVLDDSPAAKCLQMLMNDAKTKR